MPNKTPLLSMITVIQILPAQWAVIRGPAFNREWRSAQIIQAIQIPSDFDVVEKWEVGQLLGGN